MAQRRMYSLQIVDSDAFLDMSAGAQLLYFHLGMRADDDGFVSNPKKIMRMIGSNEDDLKILFAKRFLLPFESGIVVIKHWKINNYIQSDRYTPTKYLEEKRLISVKENGAYTERIQDVSMLDTQYRLGKVSIGKNTNTSSAHADFGEFWKSYPRKVGRPVAIKAFNKAITKTDLKTILASLERWKVSRQWTKDGGEFIPHPSTWLNQERWSDDPGAGITSKKTDAF